jgi:lipid II isoglutaminyl synthase (glutamine-hydrolysing)
MQQATRARHSILSPQSSSLRTAAAVLAARALGHASRRLRRGGGTALPGLVAERIDPRLVRHLARQLGGGRVIVTGTNGKTTTARMIAGALAAAGRAPVHNRSGSNLMRGLAATLAESAGPDGRIPDAGRRAGVFEVDEATVPSAAAAIAPGALIFMNLFRDQLDRYGEVDAVAGVWRRALRRLSPEATLVLNADDPTVATLAGEFAGRTLFFGVEDLAQASGSEHAADSRWCGRCGAEYAYDAAFFWHIGHWHCPGCGERRPVPQVAAESIRAGSQGTRLAMRTPAGPLALELPLSGLYNVYNALAATASSLALGVPLDCIGRGLSDFTAAFGRQEALDVRGRDVRVLLCKNPAGVNQVLRTILSDPDPLRLLVVLNDGIADGRDVSWIWDVDFEALRGRTTFAIASGRRAADMALRLKYAGVGDRLLPGPYLPSRVRHLSANGHGDGVGEAACGLVLEPDVREAVGEALAATPEGCRLYVLPTYTAMLEVRDLLAALAGRQRFWDQ